MDDKIRYNYNIKSYEGGICDEKIDQDRVHPDHCHFMPVLFFTFSPRVTQAQL